MWWHVARAMLEAQESLNAEDVGGVKKAPSSRATSSYGNGVCFSCQQPGHLTRDCLTPSGAVSSSASALHAVRPKAARALTTTRLREEGHVFTTSSSGDNGSGRCPIVIEGRMYKVNLICILMSGLYVILGMDWLTANHMPIDYGIRCLIFPKQQGCVELISTRQVETSLGEGVSCFVLLGVMNAKIEQSL
ncbi:uncharacterized protein LOC113855659 [Abrus precatorius]|uniref:Uncharacterized protein LOC113855659 n=1 Tax=Abrus precatorius TaxID=3816 RepID=A0A8B8KH47_ABRPR|nr:uncharacterized protein LOC113855659 [Abrus precatorius]